MNEHNHESIAILLFCITFILPVLIILSLKFINIDDNDNDLDSPSSL